jgi:hypothetical protein
VEKFMDYKTVFSSMVGAEGGRSVTASIRFAKTNHKFILISKAITFG